MTIFNPAHPYVLATKNWDRVAPRRRAGHRLVRVRVVVRVRYHLGFNRVADIEGDAMKVLYAAMIEVPDGVDPDVIGQEIGAQLDEYVIVDPVTNVMADEAVDALGWERPDPDSIKVIRVPADLDGRCDQCCAIPGVIHDTIYPYQVAEVMRCDQCAHYDGDLHAAAALRDHLGGGRVMYDDGTRPEDKYGEYPAREWLGEDDAVIAEGTNPWIDRVTSH